MKFKIKSLDEVIPTCKRIIEIKKKEGPLYEFNKIPRGRGLYEMG